MTDYKEMYYHLFNKVSDVIEELTELQKQCEELAMHNSELSETKIINIKQSDRTYEQ